MTDALHLEWNKGHLSLFAIYHLSAGLGHGGYESIIKQNKYFPGIDRVSIGPSDHAPVSSATIHASSQRKGPHKQGFCPH